MGDMMKRIKEAADKLIANMFKDAPTSSDVHVPVPDDKFSVAYRQKDGDELTRAKDADLVTLPDDVEGTNCANCMYVDGDYCTNPEVDQELEDGAERMCCALWDAEGTERAWEEETEKSKNGCPGKTEKGKNGCPGKAAKDIGEMSGDAGSLVPGPSIPVKVPKLPVHKIISESDGKWTLHSHSGKHLGTFNTRHEAEQREKEINYFKHVNKGFNIKRALERMRLRKSPNPFQSAEDAQAEFLHPDNAYNNFVPSEGIHGGTVKDGSDEEHFLFGRMSFDVQKAREMGGHVVNAHVQVSPKWIDKVKVFEDKAMKGTSTRPVFIAQIHTQHGLKPLLIDGNHRMHKAVETGQDKIQAHVFTHAETLQLMQGTAGTEADPEPSMINKNDVDSLIEDVLKGGPGSGRHQEGGSKTEHGKRSDRLDQKAKDTQHEGKEVLGRGEGLLGQEHSMALHNLSAANERLEQARMDHSIAHTHHEEEQSPDSRKTLSEHQTRLSRATREVQHHAQVVGRHLENEDNRMHKSDDLIAKVFGVDEPEEEPTEMPPKYPQEIPSKEQLAEMRPEDHEKEQRHHLARTKSQKGGTPDFHFKMVEMHGHMKEQKSLESQMAAEHLPRKEKSAMKKKCKEAERKGDQAHDHIMEAYGENRIDKIIEKMFENAVEIPIFKADQYKQIVYGVVLTPDEVDAQGDWMTSDDIENTAHSYLVKSRVVGAVHAGESPDSEVVESYICPQDINQEGQNGNQVVKKGAWVLGVKVNDPTEWEKVLSGEYGAFSIGGFGVRS